MAVKHKIGELPDEISRTIDVRNFNEAYLPYLNGIWAREVYYGGGSAGKSHFIAAKLLLQLTAMPGRNLVVVRRVKEVCKQTCFRQMKEALDKYHLNMLWNIVESPNAEMENIVNKNHILFLGMDDVEKVKSIYFDNGPLTDIWYEEVSEEENVETIYQLEVRLRGGNQKKRIVVSYNPVSETHFIKKLAEVTWKKKFGDDMIYVHTTYKDNKFLSAGDVANLEHFKYVDPYMYQVYCLGQYGTLGKSVFDKNKILARMGEIQDIGFDLGDFAFENDKEGLIDTESFKFFINSDGETKIYKYPEPRHPYVMSLDTAGEGSDFHAAHVIDNISGEQVAVYHSQKNPDHCVYQAFGLAQYYNNALFVPEVNFDSYHMNKFRELGYRNIYQRGSAIDDYTESYVQKLGFRTHAGNRQKMLSDCVEFVNKNVNLINDIDTLNEMLTFTRQEKKLKGVFWGAESGAFDDLVMSYAIVLQARQQAPCVLGAEQLGDLKGFWTEEGLIAALNDGIITMEQKNKYLKSRKDMNIHTVGGVKKARKSRYAR